MLGQEPQGSFIGRAQQIVIRVAKRVAKQVAAIGMLDDGEGLVQAL